jgi:hypothetical protein
MILGVVFRHFGISNSIVKLKWSIKRRATSIKYAERNRNRARILPSLLYTIMFTAITPTLVFQVKR